MTYTYNFTAISRIMKALQPEQRGSETEGDKGNTARKTSMYKIPLIHIFTVQMHTADWREHTPPTLRK
jgi:hypothetical protein